MPLNTLVSTVFFQACYRGRMARKLAREIRVRKQQEEERKRLEEIEKERQNRERESEDQLAIDEALRWVKVIDYSPFNF